MSPSLISAATISVNFTDNSSVDSTMNSSDTAGAPDVAGARVNNWNNYAADGASQAVATVGIDNTGSTVATTVGYTGALGNFRLAETPDSNGDDRMWKGFLDIQKGGAVSVGQVPYDTYSVVVYFDGQNDANFRLADYEINGTTMSGEDSENTNWKKAAPGQNPDGVYQQPVPGAGTGGDPFTGDGSPNNGEGNYLVFTGITGDSFTLNASGTSGGGSARSPINGFQIIAVPEPSTLILLCLGGLGLMRRRR